MGTNRKHANGKQQKKQQSNRLPAAAAVILVLAVIAVFVLCGGDQNDSTNSTGSTDAQVVSEGGDLVISVDEISTTAKFFPVEIDGTEMEIIAVKDSEGNIRTAFNTCQICFDSGRGYYKQDGDELVCQNCGNRFTVDQVEMESGGCNPWPIFSENKTVTDTSISIPYDYLKEATQIFANWKNN